MAKSQWSIISNHGMVLLYLAVHPDSTAREVSDHVGITERQVFRIVRDLEEASLLNVHRGKAGRNRYGVELDSSFRQPALNGMTVRQLVGTLGPSLVDLNRLGNHNGNNHNGNNHNHDATTNRRNS